MSGVLLDGVTSKVCKCCLAKVESFDEYYSKAMRIKDELCEIIKSANAFVQVKIEEIKEEAVNASDLVLSFDGPSGFVDSSCFDDETKIYSDYNFQEMPPRRLKLSKKSAKKPRKIKPDCFECPKCGKTYKEKYMLNKHLSVHDSVRKYKCPTCGKSFKCSSNYKQHEKIHAKDRVRFECDMCEANFLSKATMRHHIITAHTSIRNFLCSHCPKAFGSIMTLRGHAMTHVEFKKECCDQCGARFHNKDKLARHIRGMHSEERQFSCPICNQRFKQRYNVNAHMKTVRCRKFSSLLKP